MAHPNTHSPADEVPAFLRTMHEMLSALLGRATQAADVEAPTEYVAAVTARKSLASRDHIIPMIDGKPQQSPKAA
ncbi:MULTISPECIES: MucR family transcriptional regulator [Sphingomonas]|uniref:MucR family transcriptional regulator n=1 Tax=Sphingomonas TaxID=13687 RepID=UPI001FE880B1